MIWKILLFLLMSAVIVMAWVMPSPMNPRYSLGDPEAYRIFYFHVPQSWVAVLAFIISMVYSIKYLRNRSMEADMKAVTACRLGLLFAVLATISGSIFARMTWGEFWNWSEIRIVSVFILLIIYGAYFALRSAIPERATKAALSAVLAILFGISAVFLVFILPRVYPVFSQHPTDSIIDRGGQIAMSTEVGIVFLGALLAFTFIFLWLYNISVRVAKLRSESAEEV